MCWTWHRRDANQTIQGDRSAGAGKPSRAACDGVNLNYIEHARRPVLGGLPFPFSSETVSIESYKLSRLGSRQIQKVHLTLITVNWPSWVAFPELLAMTDIVGKLIAYVSID
jgi:hypothetical protein